MYDDNNVFAKIIRGEIQTNKVYEDEEVLAFHDICPVAPVHILVIPKAPYKDYIDFITNATSQKISNFFTAILVIIDKLNITESFRLIMNKGTNSGQSVFHFHAHIISGKTLIGLINE